MRLLQVILTVFLCTEDSSSLSLSRRSFVVSSSAVALISSPACALDMDSFADSALSTSKPSNLSPDEALCRFGQPGPQTGDACKRANLSTKRKGAVDAYGNVDRGDYVKCQYYYEIENDQYVKKTKCQ